MRAANAILLGFLFLGYTANTADAHDPGFSAVTARLDETRLVVNMSLARDDVETLVPVDADSDGVATTRR